MSPLYERIYAIVRKIPSGKVATYGQIARILGNPRLSRIVGCAMHVAPNDVPCHRVLNREGRLCDAFEPLGAQTHRLLLSMEGVECGENNRVDLSIYGWSGEIKAQRDCQ